MTKIAKRDPKYPLLFEVLSPKINRTVRTTKPYWKMITTIKHPSVRGKEKLTTETIISPDKIRVSTIDNKVFLC
ncbi:MAG: hypothetical protein ABH814_04065 [bacterium]